MSDASVEYVNGHELVTEHHPRFDLDAAQATLRCRNCRQPHTHTGWFERFDCRPPDQLPSD